MDAVRQGAANNGIEYRTFKFSALPTDKKLGKLNEIVSNTKNNMGVVYVFAGSQDLNDIAIYISQLVAAIRGHAPQLRFSDSYMLVFFDGALLPIGQHRKDADFWTQYFSRNREDKCCVCLRTDLHFFQKGTCLNLCSAVVCEACILTFTCPLCRHPDAFPCFDWDPESEEARLALS